MLFKNNYYYNDLRDNVTLLVVLIIVSFRFVERPSALRIGF